MATLTSTSAVASTSTPRQRPASPVSQVSISSRSTASRRAAWGSSAPRTSRRRSPVLPTHSTTSARWHRTWAGLPTVWHRKRTRSSRRSPTTTRQSPASKMPTLPKSSCNSSGRSSSNKPRSSHWRKRTRILRRSYHCSDNVGCDETTQALLDPSVADEPTTIVSNHHGFEAARSLSVRLHHLCSRGRRTITNVPLPGADSIST